MGCSTVSLMSQQTFTAGQYAALSETIIFILKLSTQSFSIHKRPEKGYMAESAIKTGQWRMMGEALHV